MLYPGSYHLVGQLAEEPMFSRQKLRHLNLPTLWPFPIPLPRRDFKIILIKLGKVFLDIQKISINMANVFFKILNIFFIIIV